MKSDSEPFDEMAGTGGRLFDSPSGKKDFSPYPIGGAGAPALTGVAEKMLASQIAELLQKHEVLENQLAVERALNRRLLAFDRFCQTLTRLPDIEIAGQKLAEWIQAQMGCALVCILQYQPIYKCFHVLAAAGPQASLVPDDFRPGPEISAFFQASYQKKDPNALDAAIHPGSIELDGTRFHSVLAAPLIHPGDESALLQGILWLADTEERAFQPGDIPFIESAAAWFMSTWEFTRRNDDLNEFIHAITTFSTVQEAGSLMEMIASTARWILSARYVLVAVMRQQNWVLRGAGQAPSIFASFQNGAVTFLEQALKTPYTFRLRDLRNDARTARIHIDQPELSTMLVSPIRIGGTPAGLLLAFGRTGEAAFTDNDVLLAERLANQAAANLESCYLYDELRKNLQSTQLLSNLILQIEKAENISAAVWIIANTAYRLLQARRCGLVLFAPDGHQEAEVLFPIDDCAIAHPTELIHQAMASRQTIYLAESEQTSYMVLPLQTRLRCYGALWLELSENNEDPDLPNEEINVLINQAVIALERLIFNEEYRKKAVELENRNKELQKSYEQTLTVLTRALDARDKETTEHVERVKQLAHAFGSIFGSEMGLLRSDLKSLELGALLHDIGKIGVPDAVLLKPGPLDDDEWKDMRKHPETGAQIIEQIPFLHDVLPIIKFHQERWDGSGYPEHRIGIEIPLLARIFAVIDVFDALTSDRPYREKLSEEEALEYLEQKSGIDFDPEIVTRFVKMKSGGSNLTDLF